MNTKSLITFFISVLTLVAGCANNLQESDFIGIKRDEAFYSELINEKKPAPSNQISGVKIFTNKDSFPMRFVLYDDQTFYYQVDELGDGFGNWKFSDGALVLKASRTIFDMKLYISAAKATGSELIIRFVDRFGLQTHDLEYIDPASVFHKVEFPNYRFSTKGI